MTIRTSRVAWREASDLAIENALKMKIHAIVALLGLLSLLAHCH
jgi:hypothetical protein